MIGVGYFNPLFLYGLAAVSLPIIIHLLLKKRRKRLLFSTLRFLKIATRENARRNRIKQWLLLMLRMAIVGLIIFAFARPFFRRQALAGIGPGAKEVVFLVDRSFSMAARSEVGGTKFERGLSYAADLLGELGTDDRAAVVAFDESAELVHAMTADFGALRAAFGRIEPGAHATNVSAALAYAQELFDSTDARSSSARQKAIFLVSDLQASGLGELRELELQPGVVLEVPDLTQPVANAAVVRLEAVGDELLSGEPFIVQAAVRNFSMQRRSAEATLTVAGKAVGTQQVHVGASGAAAVEFEHVIDEPGVHGASVSIDVDDALAIDNEAFVALDVRRPLRVLCVNGTPSEIPYFRETHYLETALNPYRFGGEPGTTIFAPRVIEPGELASQRLAGYDAVVLANVDYVDVAAVAALEAYVRAGGGLLVFTGDRVSLIQYNRDLYKDGEGLLPARLEPPTGSLLDVSEFRQITNFVEDHYIFESFVDPAEGDLSVPRFQRIHRLGAIDEETATALAFFSDGRPALVEKRFGRGHVLLVPTSADADWNDMPKRKVYLPFVHRTVGYLCGAEALSRIEPALLVGEPVPLPPGITTVLGPDGRAIEPADPTVLRETDVPGLYRLRFEEAPDQSIAVNVDPVESDLRCVSVAEFRELVSPEAQQLAKAGLSGEDPRDRNEIWRYVFVALLVFLLAETWLASRTHA